MRIHPFRNPSFLVSLAVIALILPPSIARATTRTVTSLADSGVGTLRDAIAASGDGDLINLSVTGVISLTSGALIVSKNIIIAGPGATQLEVTRGNSNNFRIFQVDGGQTIITVFISGISVTNGHTVAKSGETAGGFGGGILNANATLTLSNCIINNNTAVSSTLQSSGGGICSFSGSTLTVDGCTLSGNNANFGGAISNSKSLVLKNSNLSGNSADIGGGIETGGGLAVVSNCTFVNNIATSKGGGASNVNGTLTVSNCTFDHNTSNSSGGGIYNEGQDNNGVGNATVNNSTLSGNAAPSGGAIYNNGTNSGNAFVQLGNTILQTGGNGANLVNAGLGTSITSQGYNLSNDNGSGFLTAAGDQINTNPQLGPLQNNGGPTLTMALLTGSPAQDKGKRFNVTTDQRGLPRPTDIPSIPNASGGDGSDIGAVEMTAIAPFVVTTTADHDDGTCNASDCTLREAINAANAAVGTNTIIFGNGVNGTITLQSALGTLTVTDSVIIMGPGARFLSVSGNGAIRVFSFNTGSSAISGLTIRDGNKTDAAGSGRTTTGGGIFNAQNATLTISDCAFTNNRAQGADSATVASVGGNGNGGAISNSGTLTLSNCTLDSNLVFGGRGGDGSSAINGNVHGGDGGAAQGGAIFNDTTGTLVITNCTLVANHATGGTGGNGPAGFGGNGGNATGGVVNTGTMTVTAVTLTGNGGTGGPGGTGNNRFNGGSAGKASGGLTSTNNTSTIRSTISAGNTGSGAGLDVDGSFSSGGYNLIGTADHSSGFTTADQTGSDAAPLNAMLGFLQNNGGFTDTVALLTGSPAIDKGNSFGLATDQRGLAIFDDLSNPNAAGGDGRDVGAFELKGGETPPTILANIATRLLVGTGDNVLIGGFIISGTQPKKVIVRAIGPSVPLAGVLADPILELHGPPPFVTITNDNWRTSQEAAIMATGVAPTNDLESAIVATLPSNNAGYTAIVRGVNNGTGIGLVEAYDLDSTVDSKLANISTRGLVQTGDNVLIAGTIVLGQTTQKVIVRALGPSLNVPGELADPTLELHDGNGTLIDANDNWVDSPNKQAIIDSTIPPTNNLESAIVYTFSSSGAHYTAIVRGVNNSTGVAVVEVYALN